MEEISHTRGLAESTLYKWTFYQKLFKDSMHLPFKIPILFCASHRKLTNIQQAIHVWNRNKTLLKFPNSNYSFFCYYAKVCTSVYLNSKLYNTITVKVRSLLCLSSVQSWTIVHIPVLVSFPFAAIKCPDKIN